MSVSAQRLFDAKYASNSTATEYTSAASTYTIIDAFTATNQDASSQTVSIYLVPSGSSASASNLIVKARSIAAGSTYIADEIKNHVLNPGDFIAVVASASSLVTIRASGRKVT